MVIFCICYDYDKKIILDVLWWVWLLIVDVMFFGFWFWVIELLLNLIFNVVCDKVYMLIIISMRWFYGVLLDLVMICVWVIFNK